MLDGCRPPELAVAVDVDDACFKALLATLKAARMMAVRCRGRNGRDGLAM